MQSTSGTVRAMLILAVLFFLFGFVTWLNGTLIPYLKLACQLTTFESLLVATAFYIAYFVMALPAAKLLERVGYKNGMTIGLLGMALGALVFIPAAMTRTYGLFLAGLFVIGTGLTVLQTASNPYATIIGPIESAAARISILGICNKLAGVLAPIIMGGIILKNADAIETSLPTLDAAGQGALLDELAARVIVPYAWMAAALGVLAIGLRMAPLPPIPGETQDAAPAKGNVWAHPQLVLGVIALFLYVGVEVIAVDTIGIYGKAAGVAMDSAKLLPSYTLLAMVACYILGIIAIPRFLGQSLALRLSAILGVALTLMVVFAPLTAVWQVAGVDMDTFRTTTINVPVSVLFVALLGLANALMWPAIWPLAIDGLGHLTKQGSALLIMAILGGALLPPLYGALAGESATGHQHAYWIMVPCYLFIFWYAVKGHQRRSWE
ncbi:MAG TPA: sugar MFS transporter [Flavobacteriales bacterium]|nr:sugar MFS transporter [Flavobacteriales bacterium]